MTSPIFFDHFDRSLPALKLGSVQLSQMQHLTLHPFAADPQTLAQRIINMMLTILENAVGLQKHTGIFSTSNPSCLQARLSHGPKRPLFASSPEEEPCKKKFESRKICEG
jgi:hypothetical protein